MSTTFLLFNGLRRTFIRGPINFYGHGDFDNLLENIQAPEHGMFGSLLTSTVFLQNLRNLAANPLAGIRVDQPLFVKDVEPLIDDELEEIASGYKFKLARPVPFSASQSAGSDWFELCDPQNLPDEVFQASCTNSVFQASCTNSVLVPEDKAYDFLERAHKLHNDLRSFAELVRSIDSNTSIGRVIMELAALN